MPTENQIDCPALHKRSNSYPFGNRVPRTVLMLKAVTADPMPGIGLSYIKGDAPVAKEGQTYPVWTNSHGAVTAVMENGIRLGLRPAEFEVDSWHDLAAEPEPQHPEPIAWMVGTAIWWTKEEAERDAAATGLPIVGLGPMTDRTATELAESETMAAIAELAECEAMADMVAEREWAEHVGTGDVSSKVEAAFTQLHNDLHEAGEKLAERDTLLRENSGKLIRMAAHLISAPLFALQDLQDEDKKMSRARVDKAVDTADARLKDAAYELRRIADALSASAEPSAPVAQA